MGPHAAVHVAPHVTSTPVMLLDGCMALAEAKVAAGISVQQTMAVGCVGYALSNVFRAAGVFVPNSQAPSTLWAEFHTMMRNFGWLQADMRMPLPSITDLRDACHPIGTQ